MISLKDKLAKFYNDESKHSRYQNIPDFIKEETGYEEELIPLWRSDIPRYIQLIEFLDSVNWNSIIDVGANTGYFSMSLAKKYPDKTVYAVEQNPNHLEFIGIVKEHFNIKNLKPINSSLTMLSAKDFIKADVLMLYNVLHHAGVDFDEGLIKSIDDFESYALDYLKPLNKSSKYLIFQMGYNWGGNKKKPIIELNDDVGKVTFTNRILTNSGWEIIKVAYPKLNNTKDGYDYFWESESFLNHLADEPFLKNHLPLATLATQSEFFRRPIFICKSNTK